MENHVLFFTKSAVSLFVFYAIYWLILRKETFFMLNRFYLLGSVLFSLSIPFLSFMGSPTSNPEEFSYVLNTITVTNSELLNVYSQNISLIWVLWIVYLSGVVLFTIRFLFNLLQLYFLVKRYKICRKEGLFLIFTDAGFTPFSFFNLIFLNKSISVTDAEKVMTHEQIHVRQLHSFDILFFELLIIFQWFNPVVWLYKHSIKEVHEFLADKGVLTKGYGKIGYQQLLLALSLNINVTDLTNNFNTSQIKRRFIMMTKMKSGLTAKVKILITVPVIAGVMVVFGCNNADTKEQNPVENKTGVINESNTIIKSEKVEGEIFAVVEEMPVFGNTPNALNDYISSNVKYPQAAKEKGIQGKVYVSFVVTKAGKVTEVEVIKSVNALLDAEAVRVISAMPDWTPGKQKGAAVNVKFNLPINFKLS